MLNLHLIISKAWWILNERVFNCFIIFFVWKANLNQEITNQLGESSPNFIFTVVNLDPIILEKRWIDGESWPNDFVKKVNRGKDLRWVGSRCPLAHALVIGWWLKFWVAHPHRTQIWVWPPPPTEWARHSRGLCGCNSARHFDLYSLFRNEKRRIQCPVH